MPKVNNNDSKDTILITGLQCKLARTAVGLGLRELADLVQMSPNTISRLERGEQLQPKTLKAIQSALEKAGIEFIPENGGGEGVRLKKTKN